MLPYQIDNSFATTWKRLANTPLPAIALANKLARIAWAVLNKERNFECVEDTRCHPNLLECGIMLGAVKANPFGWPQRAASLDSPCAQRPGCAGRDGGTASRPEQRNCNDKETAMT